MIEHVMVAKLSDFAEGDHRVFAVGGREVGVFRMGDGVVAYDNVCPHLGGPVCQGSIFNRVGESLTEGKQSRGLVFTAQRHVVCPWHGFEFDLETGCHPGDPRLRMRRLDTELRGEEIYVKITVRDAA